MLGNMSGNDIILTTFLHKSNVKCIRNNENHAQASIINHLICLTNQRPFLSMVGGDFTQSLRHFALTLTLTITLTLTNAPIPT